MGEITLGCADVRVVVEGDRGQPFASVSGAYLLGIQCAHVQPLQRQPWIYGSCKGGVYCLDTFICFT